MRKGKLWRPCEQCERKYEPSGSASRMCNKCQAKNYKNRGNKKYKKYKK